MITYLPPSSNITRTYKWRDFTQKSFKTKLGANLLGQESNITSKTGSSNERDGNASGGSGNNEVDGTASVSASTINSTKSQKTLSALKLRQDYNEQISALQADNSKLLQELIESQRSYQILLRQILDEHRLQTQALREICQQFSSSISSLASSSRAISPSSCNNNNNSNNNNNNNSPSIITSDYYSQSNKSTSSSATDGVVSVHHVPSSAPVPEQHQTSTPQPPPPSPFFTSISPFLHHRNVPSSSVDTRLMQWLQGLGLDVNSINKILDEQYCLEDLLYYVQRSDIKRINLKGGIELKLWRAILQHRHDNRQSTPPEENDNFLRFNSNIHCKCSTNGHISDI